MAVRSSAKTARGRGLGRPFPKGVSGNPKGRPAGVQNRATRDGRELAQAIVNDPEYRARLLERLRAGDAPPAVECMAWAYAFGKPPQNVEVTGEDGGPIRSAVVFTLPDNGRRAE